MTTEIRFNNQSGLLGVSLLAASPGDSEIHVGLFQDVPKFATLGAGEYIKLCLDYVPDEHDNDNGSFEIVYLTAYTAGSKNGTITRAAEDSTNWPAVAHTALVSAWGCNPTAADFGGGSVAPADVNMTLASGFSIPGGATVDEVTGSNVTLIGGKTYVAVGQIGNDGNGNVYAIAPVASYNGSTIVAAAVADVTDLFIQQNQITPIVSAPFTVPDTGDYALYVDGANGSGAGGTVYASYGSPTQITFLDRSS